MDQTVFRKRLIDYMVLVGPGRGNTANPDGFVSQLSSSWHQVRCPTPTILNRFPSEDHHDFELAYDMVYFCHPEGSCVQMEGPKTHIFMLTDTETNTRTYGVCLSKPHLFDPHYTQGTNHVSNSSCRSDREDFCSIQEWGVLSVCLLSQHPFFNFFAKCLQTLTHFVEDFGDDNLSWEELIRYPQVPLEDTKPTSPKDDADLRDDGNMLSEVMEWIEQLLKLEAPEQGSALEVELEVDPAFILAYPSPNRLPMFDISLYHTFKCLDVYTVIEIYKLVLSEQKVIVHSSDGFFASECVLSVLALLYPLQYLFPLIPLLPTSMPTSENLLMVPTPFFFGVCTSFLEKVQEVSMAEIWIINLDTKKVKYPVQFVQPLLNFPFSILQLQADIRRAMDKYEVAHETTSSKVSRLGTLANNRKNSPNTTQTLVQVANKFTSHPQVIGCRSFPQLRMGEDSFMKHFQDDIDTEIRISFVDFLFSAEILGLIDQCLCIYRLFPRPVVTLRKSAFLRSYEKIVATTDTRFVRGLIQSQCVEYFLEWSLNPTNTAFEEIRRGVHDISRLSDKQFHHIHHQAFRMKQVCLYYSSPSSLLYQEMLSYKGSQPSHSRVSLTKEEEEEDDDSDWEYLVNSRSDYYDGDSESSHSSISYFSDEENKPSSHVKISQQVRHHGAVVSSGDNLQDDIEVGYFSTRRVHSVVPNASQQVSPPDKETSTGGRGARDTGDPSIQEEQKLSLKSLVNTGYQSKPITETDGPKKSLSFENLSLSDVEDHSEFRHLGNQFQGTSAYVTSTEYLTPHPFDTDTDHTHRDDSPPDCHNHSGFSSATSEDGVKHSHTPHQNRVNILDDTSILPLKQPVDSNHKQTKAQESVDDSLLLSLSSNTSSDKVEFATPISTLPRQQVVSPTATVEDGESHGQVARTVLALSALNTSQTLDNQIGDIVNRIVGGQGIPWLKVATLKRLAGYEKTRVIILRHLEERLGVRNSSEIVMATNPQLSHVGVTKGVYRGLLDLLKLLLQCVEEDFQVEPEGPLFSVFLVFRISFSVYHELKPKSTLGFSLRSALGVSSSLLGHTDSSKPLKETRPSLNESLTQSKGGGRKSLRVTRAQIKSSSLDSSTILSTSDSTTSNSLELTNVSASTMAGDDTSAHVSESHSKLISPTPENSPNQSPSYSTPRTSGPTSSSTKAVDGEKMDDKNSLLIFNSPVKPSHISSIMVQDDLINVLVNSPRFFHRPDGQDLKECNFLYKDLLKVQGTVRPFLLKKAFWNAIFMSVIDTDRGFIGWNERTADLYRRYNILPACHRKSFGAEEDHLLSIIAHNLLVYMLMVGMSSKVTMNLVQGFTARTRLATIEEKLLQRTMQHVEQNASSEIDLSDLGLMALYSEVHPTISYIVHYGVSMIAPVYKIQITDEALILRRFPDEKISARLWNDCITLIQQNESRATVSVWYKDTHGEFAHHFHTKQYEDVYNSLQALVVLVNTKH